MYSTSTAAGPAYAAASEPPEAPTHERTGTVPLYAPFVYSEKMRTRPSS